MRHTQSILSVAFVITISLAIFACSSSSGDDNEEISSSSALSSSSAEISSSSEVVSSSSVIESSSSVAELSSSSSELNEESSSSTEISSSSSEAESSSSELSSSSFDGYWNPNIEYGTLNDTRDGKTYRTIEIGDQTWMAENLNYNASGSKCYDNDPANCAIYGRLYDWEIAIEVCPYGWHLPDTTEWRILINYVGTAAGTKLKSTSGWIDCNDKNYCDDESGNGTDNYGFSALPSGAYCDEFDGVGEGSGWWTTTEYNDNAIEAYDRIMLYDMRGIGKNRKDKSFGFSVRCLKD